MIEDVTMADGYLTALKGHKMWQEKVKELSNWISSALISPTLKSHVSTTLQQVFKVRLLRTAQYYIDHYGRETITDFIRKCLAPMGNELELCRTPLVVLLSLEDQKRAPRLNLDLTMLNAYDY